MFDRAIFLLAHHPLFPHKFRETIGCRDFRFVVGLTLHVSLHFVFFAKRFCSFLSVLGCS